MANRSYLYSTNLPSDAAPDQGNRRITGISEWNYDIPLVYKILLSGNPRTCRSLIWKSDDRIALVGDYIAGAEKLLLFCDSIGHPDLLPLAREAGEFLVEARNKNRYFHLECAEVFFLSHENGFEMLADDLLEGDPEHRRTAGRNRAGHPEHPPTVGRRFPIMGAGLLEQHPLLRPQHELTA